MCNAQARHLNLLLPQGNSSSAFFCITKPRKALEVDLTHLQKTGTAQLSYSMAIQGFFFKISRPLRNVKFTPCTRRQFNRQISLHITWFFKQKLTPPLYQHYPNPFLIKERRKSENLSLKSFFRTSEQPFAIHFLVASYNVFPVVIPEICA